MAKKSNIDIFKHTLVPKHTKLTQKETKELFEKYNISFFNLPKISINDPAIQNLNLKEEDIVKIERKSQTKGISYYYRGVVNE
ncbi:MAG: DNA-directed RNA polymerase subunit H [Candidatus Woesearchaeota archaeon]